MYNFFCNVKVIFNVCGFKDFVIVMKVRCFNFCIGVFLNLFGREEKIIIWL